MRSPENFNGLWQGMLNGAVKHLPFESEMIHARWSGEATWISLGNSEFGVSYENHTSRPSKGGILLYPGGIGETETLIPYKSTQFSSKV
ncbi:DUF3830 family protein [Desulfitobacterium dichloroeliminans]|uniref:DUF3830 family protein n=1 Tax=Desulfitobacterium dichloroeliminans TaxID=233055 RepID=UPI0002498540|nr:DUF3830 family protein [Desulfitobacterium dichloroeliminans]